MSYLSVSKFDQYQHYKSRRPSWVKFYVSLLDTEHPLNALPVPTRYLFDRLLLLAANYNNAIPKDFELLAKLLRMDPKECREGCEQLLKGRWIKETQTKRRASKGASKGASTILSPEAEAEAERDTALVVVPTSTLDVAPRTAISNGPSGKGKLSDERWYLVEKILQATSGVDPNSRGVLEAYAGKVSISSLADVADRAQGHDVGWAVAALKGERHA